MGRRSGACIGVKCLDCPLNINSDRNDDEVRCAEELTNPDKAFKAVMEYESKVDWSKVEVDTKVLVKDFKNDIWIKRYFAKYKNGIVYTWNDGRTSFICFNNYEITHWKYAKLYKGDE